MVVLIHSSPLLSLEGEERAIHNSGFFCFLLFHLQVPDLVGKRSIKEASKGVGDPN